MLHGTSPESLITQLGWRYATRVFDPEAVIGEGTWSALEQALVLTPSSFGLQPWHFVVITDRALRERLMACSWGQRQVVDCSHFVVLCARRELGTVEIDRHLQRLVEVRGTPPEKLAALRQVMVKALVEGPMRPSINEWAIRQVYIALGNFMTAAAMLGVDTCPMEGFQPAEYDRILELDGTGFASAVACAAGYRSAGDRYATLPKVRFPLNEVVERR